MFCQYQYYRNTKELQRAVDHTNDRYQCKEMSDCPYTGTTLINKIPWGDYPGGEPKSSEDPDGLGEESEDSNIQAKVEEGGLELATGLSLSVKTEQDLEDAQYEKTQAAALSLSLTDQEGSQSVSAHLGGKSGNRTLGNLD